VTSSGHLWRRLGEILVGRSLLTQGGLARALREQERSGRLLGEILVERGWVSSTELAAALAEQHGVELEFAPAIGTPRRPFATVTPTGGAFPATPWKPLGRLLVDRGLLSVATLDEALDVQRTSGRLLGEILVERGWVAPEDVAETLAEQQGLRPLPRDEIRAQAKPVEERQANEVSYEVWMNAGEAEPLHVSASFLDATDFAFDLLDRGDPDLLEIVKVRGDQRERVWGYDRARASRDGDHTTEAFAPGSASSS
jgi:hypothetical protein